MSAKSWRLTESETHQLFELHPKLARYYGKNTQLSDPDELARTTLIDAAVGYERRSTLQYFVFAIARRKVADHWRRLGRRSSTAAPGAPATERGLETWLSLCKKKESLRAALAAVPEVYREVVRLWLAGHDNFQIAATLSLNYNTTRSRLSRGKAMLIEECRLRITVEA